MGNCCSAAGRATEISVASPRVVLGYWVTSQGQGCLRDVALPAVGAKDCELTAIFTGVSKGTERLVGMGRVPAECAEPMACRGMQGNMQLPVLYGYSFVGRLTAGEHAGRSAFTMHPHQERAVVAREHLVLLPSGMPPSRATLFPNLETAWNAMWDAELIAGERVAVVGGEQLACYSPSCCKACWACAWSLLRVTLCAVAARPACRGQWRSLTQPICRAEHLMRCFTQLGTAKGCSWQSMRWALRGACWIFRGMAPQKFRCASAADFTTSASGSSRRRSPRWRACIVPAVMPRAQQPCSSCSATAGWIACSTRRFRLPCCLSFCAALPW